MKIDWIALGFPFLAIWWAIGQYAKAKISENAMAVAYAISLTGLGIVWALVMR